MIKIECIVIENWIGILSVTNPINVIKSRKLKHTMYYWTNIVLTIIF
jgi:hypothetical protein